MRETRCANLKFGLPNGHGRALPVASCRTTPTSAVPLLEVLVYTTLILYLK